MILACDDGRGGEPVRDLLRDVRAGEDGDGAVGDERREPLAGGGIETLRQAQHRTRTGQRGDDLRESGARHGDGGEVRLRDGRGCNRRRLDPVQVDVGEVPRVASRRRDRGRLVLVAAGERHLVPVVAQHDRERRPPGAAADDRDAHAYSLLTKSMETGTPWRSNFLRSSFSTQ